MKKILAPLLVGLVASFCLVVVGGSAATASPAAADPYPGSVDTECRVRVERNADNRRPRVVARVRVPGSSAQPKGTVKIVLKRKGKVVLRKSVSNSAGKPMKFLAPKAAKARRLKVTVTFTPASGTVFVGCTSTATSKPKA